MKYLEIFNRTCATIGLSTIIYIITKQPITPFAVIIWGIIGFLLNAILYSYEFQEEN